MSRLKDDAEEMGRRVGRVLHDRLEGADWPLTRNELERRLEDAAVDLPSGRHVDLEMAVRQLAPHSFEDMNDLTRQFVASGVLREGGAGDATADVGDLDAEGIIGGTRQYPGGKYDVTESGVVARGSEPGEPETRRRREE